MNVSDTPEARSSSFWRGVCVRRCFFLQFLGAHSRVVAYLPSLRTILHRLRATSSTPSSLFTSSQLPQPTTPSLPPHTLSAPSLLTSSDGGPGETFLNPRFPLPGAVAPATTTPTPETTPGNQETPPMPVVTSGKIVCLCVCLFTSCLSSVSESEQGLVECLVQMCPPSLHAGFMDLFPGAIVEKGVITSSPWNVQSLRSHGGNW